MFLYLTGLPLIKGQTLGTTVLPVLAYRSVNI